VHDIVLATLHQPRHAGDDDREPRVVEPDVVHTAAERPEDRFIPPPFVEQREEVAFDAGTASASEPSDHIQ
jgi:hypothetical protein